MKTVAMILELAAPLQAGFHIRIENEPWMTLVVEDMQERGPNGLPAISVAHYGEQNGDLMRDPEMIFEAEESGEQLNLVPYCWRNDYAGVEQYSALLEEGRTILNAKLRRSGQLPTLSPVDSRSRGRNHTAASGPLRLPNPGRRLLMNCPTLSNLLSSFFLRYLADERGVSPNTTASYRDSVKLLLQYAATRLRRSVDRLAIHDLTGSLVLDFLADLETNRGNTTRTRNARLAAIQTFFRYVAGREPALAACCSPVLAIPAKKALHPVLGYLSEQELGHLLAQVDRLAKHGERDYVLLSVLYDTGARIQELLDLTPRDFHLETPPFVRIRGKGRRERLCPLLPQSARLIRTFLSAHGRRFDEQGPLLQNGRGTRLSRHGARYILLKYLRRAANSMPTLARARISPHTMRHTKAMHLLQSGVPLVMVKDFLGHVDLKSTEVYVQADLEMKRKALDLAGGLLATQPPHARLSASLIDWLESL